MTTAEQQRWVELAMIGVAAYVVYKVVTGVTNTVSTAATTVYQGAQNLDANLGLSNFDAYVSSLFAPQPGGTL